MKFRFNKFVIFSSLVLFLAAGTCYSQKTALGLFEGHGDIGSAGKTGLVEYDASQKSYQITGGGENMWFNNDALHFVWKKVSGDVSLAADIRWIGTGGNAHRKACVIIRQSLGSDSAYADAALHGDGLTSIQCREVKGGTTTEVQSNVTAPSRVRIEKQGDYVFIAIAREGEKLRNSGGSFKLKLAEPFYIGLGVCAHDNKVTEKAVFSKVELMAGRAKEAGEAVLESTLEKIPLAGDRRVVYHTRGHIEAPNWSLDGKELLFNNNGRIYRLPVAGGSLN